MAEQYELNDRVFAIGTIPPFEAIAVEVAIAKVIGEPLFKAFMGASTATNESGDDNSMAVGAAAIGLITSKMDADDLIKTMETVFKYVNVDGKRCDVNRDFNGRNKELWQVFIKALRVNFSDFLTAGLLDSFAAKFPASS